jgi:hypothetical protein
VKKKLVAPSFEIPGKRANKKSKKMAHEKNTLINLLIGRMPVTSHERERAKLSRHDTNFADTLPFYIVIAVT